MRVRQLHKATDRSATPTKLAQASKLLTKARGATMAELGAATGWQPHSVRAMLSGLRKKGVVLVKETRKSGESCYRMEVAKAASVDPQGTLSEAAASTASIEAA